MLPTALLKKIEVLSVHILEMKFCLFGFAPYANMTLDSIISYMSIMFVVLYASHTDLESRPPTTRRLTVV